MEVEEGERLGVVTEELLSILGRRIGELVSVIERPMVESDAHVACKAAIKLDKP
jgi:hypothetical protein